ncbi:MAG: anthranilate synthase component I family protein [Ginsengibacter sp.]
MKRKFTSYPINNYKVSKSQMLNFGKKFGIFCFLDNNGYEFDKSYECIAAAGAVQSTVASDIPALDVLNRLRTKNNDWIFGHIAYDVKNEIENFVPANPDNIRFPDLHFFIPEIIFILNKTELRVGVFPGMEPGKIYDEIISYNPAEIPARAAPVLKSRFSPDEYIDTVKKLQQHIVRGDCYEINFCQEFYAGDTVIDPQNVYQKLSELSPNPFSVFYKYEDRYLICASPERFLKKTGSTIISQPMKGTAKRIAGDVKADEMQRENLFHNEKERSENIMIVDLVRNDLAKICTEGSVHVRDFLQVYPFPQVHQMISTIEGNLRENTAISEIFAATFPMGSMTGAPKKRVMELIGKYERTKRGLFSGTVGYVNPVGDFDFNVVIRSLLYNEQDKYISIQAGSAITFNSIPQHEYDECLLKVAAIRKALA